MMTGERDSYVVAAEELEELQHRLIMQATPKYNCKICGHLSCVCSVLANHQEDCRFRRSVTCPVVIACEHGYDVCPMCDPCTCTTTGA